MKEADKISGLAVVEKVFNMKASWLGDSVAQKLSRRAAASNASEEQSEP